MSVRTVLPVVGSLRAALDAPLAAREVCDILDGLCVLTAAPSVADDDTPAVPVWLPLSVPSRQPPVSTKRTLRAPDDDDDDYGGDQSALTALRTLLGDEQPGLEASRFDRHARKLYLDDLVVPVKWFIHNNRTKWTPASLLRVDLLTAAGRTSEEINVYMNQNDLNSGLDLYELLDAAVARLRDTAKVSVSDFRINVIEIANTIDPTARNKPPELRPSGRYAPQALVDLIKGLGFGAYDVESEEEVLAEDPHTIGYVVGNGRRYGTLKRSVDQDGRTGWAQDDGLLRDPATVYRQTITAGSFIRLFRVPGPVAAPPEPVAPTHAPDQTARAAVEVVVAAVLGPNRPLPSLDSYVRAARSAHIQRLEAESMAWIRDEKLSPERKKGLLLGLLRANSDAGPLLEQHAAEMSRKTDIEYDVRVLFQQIQRRLVDTTRIDHNLYFGYTSAISTPMFERIIPGAVVQPDHRYDPAAIVQLLGTVGVGAEVLADDSGMRPTDPATLGYVVRGTDRYHVLMRERPGTEDRWWHHANGVRSETAVDSAVAWLRRQYALKIIPTTHGTVRIVASGGRRSPTPVGPVASSGPLALAGGSTPKGRAVPAPAPAAPLSLGTPAPPSARPTGLHGPRANTPSPPRASSSPRESDRPSSAPPSLLADEARPRCPPAEGLDGSANDDGWSAAAAFDAVHRTVGAVLDQPERYVFEIAGPGAARHYVSVLAAAVLLAVQHGRTVVLRIVDPDAVPGTGFSRSHPWRSFARQHGRVTARMLLEHARRMAAVAGAAAVG